MLSPVLKSKRAVQMNIVMRAFVKLRELLAHRLEQVESTLKLHDHAVATVYQVQKLQAAPPEPPQRRIGFRTTEEQ